MHRLVNRKMGGQSFFQSLARLIAGGAYVAMIVVLAGRLSVAQAPAAAPALTWEQVQEQFRRNNPNLVAGRTNVEETRANEITAGLRPNPQLSLTVDQWRLFQGNPYRPFGGNQTIGQYSQLLERQNKRPLRVESAKLASAISATDLADVE